MGSIVAAEHGQQPLWCLLVAGDKTLGAKLVAVSISDSCVWSLVRMYNSSSGIHGTRQSVNRDNMGGLVVPWAVLSPVGSGDLLPGVVEVAGVGKDLHLCGL